MTKEEIGKLFLEWDKNSRSVYLVDKNNLKIETRKFLGYEEIYGTSGVKRNETITLQRITDDNHYSSETVQPDSVYATYEQAAEVLNKIINDKIKSLEALKA